VFANLTAGRNRGFGHSNDFLFEKVRSRIRPGSSHCHGSSRIRQVSDVTLSRTVTIKVKGGADVPLDIYRSHSPGFVIQHNANADVLSLRVCAAPPRRCTYLSVLSTLCTNCCQPYRSSSSVSRQSNPSIAHADGHALVAVQRSLPLAPRCAPRRCSFGPVPPAAAMACRGMPCDAVPLPDDTAALG
jgi:hypothetical protein